MNIVGSKDNVFKKLRLRVGIESVETAAKDLGVSVSYLYSIENGWRKPSKRVLKKMIELYKCDSRTSVKLFFAS